MGNGNSAIPPSNQTNEEKILESIRTNKSFEIRAEKLNLKGKDIGVDGARKLSSAISKNSTLIKLNLAENNIGDVGTKALSEGLKVNSSIKNLYLYCNNIGSKGTEALSSVLENNTTIIDLNFGGNNIGVKGASALSSSLKINTTLTDLELFGNNIDNKCAIELSPFLKTNSTLTTLNLSDNKIGADGAHALSQAIAKNVKLRHLDLGSNEIGDDGASRISQFLKTNNTLTILDLRKNNIVDNGAKELSIALKTNTTLTQLLLDSNKIGDSGVIELSTSLISLKKLNLGDNNIGVKGANALSSSLTTNSTLTELNLHRNKLGPEGAKELSSFIKKNTTLTILNIVGNSIGIEGANAISLSLSTNTTLKCLFEKELKDEVKIEVKEIKKKEETVIINEVEEWFQKQTILSAEQQEEYANLFKNEGFEDLKIISKMTEGDLKLIKEKSNLSLGNYRKICVIVEDLKKISFEPKMLPESSSHQVHPWYIDPSVKNLNWNKINSTFSLLPLSNLDPSLQSTYSQFTSILKSLNGSLDDLKSVCLSYNSNLENMFQSSLDIQFRSLQEDPMPYNDELWRNRNDGGIPWRQAIYRKFREYTLKFPNNDNREEDGLVVIPVVTGYKDMETAKKVCNNGPNCVAAYDEGYFGRGISFSTNINYAKKFGKFLVISWVFIGNLYPVIEFPHPPVGSLEFYENLPNYQKPTLYGKPQKNDKIFVNLETKTVTYDTHYTIVRPFTDEGDPPTTMKYVPCEVEKMENENVFDVVVVFQESHVLPMYLIDIN